MALPRHLMALNEYEPSTLRAC